MTNPLRFAGTALAVMYGAYVGFVVIRVAGFSHGLSTLGFFCWAVSPLAALVGFRYRRIGAAGPVGEIGWLLALLALAVFGVAVYQEAFFGSRPDAQSGLALVFIPLYQWIAVIIVLALLTLVARRRKVTPAA